MTKCILAVGDYEGSGCLALACLLCYWCDWSFHWGSCFSFTFAEIIKISQDKQGACPLSFTWPISCLSPCSGFRLNSNSWIINDMSCSSGNGQCCTVCIHILNRQVTDTKMAMGNCGAALQTRLRSYQTLWPSMTIPTVKCSGTCRSIRPRCTIPKKNEENTFKHLGCHRQA